MMRRMSVNEWEAYIKANTGADFDYSMHIANFWKMNGDLKGAE